MPDISNKESINMYIHCIACIDQELPQEIEAGWTDIGLQIWCKNHNCNIIHIDFEDHIHPVNANRPRLIGVPNV